jgi:hypothetical protein
MMDMGEALNGYGERDGKKAKGPKEGEEIGRDKLGGMGMMGIWIEVETHLSKKKKLTIGSSSCAYLDSWDVR